ncbi:hypothetical protein BC940DRAFT_304344, partial [Gongronella butleri]
MNLDQETIHVVVRLPFKRPADFVEPPPVVWTDEMEQQLWKFLSQKPSDWREISEKLGVPPMYLARHAAFKYEKQLRDILRLVSIPIAPPSTPTPPPAVSSSSTYSQRASRMSQRQGPSTSTSTSTRMATPVSAVTPSPAPSSSATPLPHTSTSTTTAKSPMDTAKSGVDRAVTPTSPPAPHQQDDASSMMLSTISTIMPRPSSSSTTATGSKHAYSPQPPSQHLHSVHQYSRQPSPMQPSHEFASPVQSDGTGASIYHDTLPSRSSNDATPVPRHPSTAQVDGSSSQLHIQRQSPAKMGGTAAIHAEDDQNDRDNDDFSSTGHDGDDDGDDEDDQSNLRRPVAKNRREHDDDQDDSTAFSDQFAKMQLAMEEEPAFLPSRKSDGSFLLNSLRLSTHGTLTSSSSSPPRSASATPMMQRTSRLGSLQDASHQSHSAPRTPSITTTTTSTSFTTSSSGTTVTTSTNAATGASASTSAAGASTTPADLDHLALPPPASRIENDPASQNTQSMSSHAAGKQKMAHHAHHLHHHHHSHLSQQQGASTSQANSSSSQNSSAINSMSSSF